MVPLTLQPAVRVAVPAETLSVEPATSKVPLTLSVAAPLTPTTPPPVTKDPAASTWLPPPKLSVAPGVLLRVPVCVPPPSRLSVPDSVCTRPLLWKGEFRLALTVPPVLRKTPTLLKVAGAVATLRRPSKVRSKIPPAWLLITAPLPAVKLPEPHEACPVLFNVRPVSVTPPWMASTPPGPMLVAPVPLRVPLAQLRVPFTAKLPAPVSVLLPTVSVSWPFELTTLAPLRVRMERPRESVCVPVAPPSVRLPTVGLTASGTVTV